MLKWLKQKPVNGQEWTLTTDDPLATIQIKQLNSNSSKIPFGKNSSPTSNEIYAVTRVNPLFQDENGKSALTPGNHSGSSGYDSAPTSDDDEGRRKNVANNTGVMTTDVIKSQGHLLRSPNLSQAGIYENPTDLIKPKLTTFDPPSGDLEPILNVILQNPRYVNRIGVAIEPPPSGQPLTLLAESVSTFATLPIPIRNTDPPARKPGDKIGSSGKLIQTNSNYVQSIRIVPKGDMSGFGRRPLRRALSHNGLKPSVTFCDRVEVVQGKASPFHQSGHDSIDQDSIVTDTLLLMTASLPKYGHMERQMGSNEVVNVHYSPSDEMNSLDEVNDLNEVFQPPNSPDLNSFSDSLSKHPMVKTIVSRASASPNDMSPDEDGSDLENDNNDGQSNLPHPHRHLTSTKSPFGGIADHYAAAKEIAKEIESYSNGTTKSTRISMVKDLLLSSRGRMLGHTHSSPPIDFLPTVTDWETRRRLTSSNDLKVDNQRPELLTMDGHNPPITKSILPLLSPPHPSSSSKSPLVITESCDIGNDLNNKPDHPWQQRQVRVEVQSQVWVKANDDPKPLHDHYTTQTTYSQSESLLLTTSPMTSDGGTGGVRMRTPDDNHSHYHLPQGQDQEIPIYEAISPQGTVSSISHDENLDDSDSGHSTDRNPKDDHSSDESIRKTSTSPPNVSTTPPIPNTLPGGPKIPIHRKPPNFPPNTDKIMIVSGDHQNLVVDLSGVPIELREAIISGTALVALPEDSIANSTLPGYTMIAIPQDHHYEIIPSNQKSHFQKTTDPKELIKQGRELNYTTQNLAQVWDVLQKKQGKGPSKSKERITAILPYHPNQDSHTTADFTIEGQPLARQTKRVQRLKTRRCCCRIVGAVIFLIAFFGVIVALSLIYTKGKHYFGPVHGHHLTAQESSL